MPCKTACCGLATLVAGATFAMSSPPENVPWIGHEPRFAFDKAEFSSPWKMQQAWRPKPERGFRAGKVRMAWDSGALWVIADLPDREVFSASTAHGQKLWMLGDVFEIFVQREGTTRYLELHVSPNNHRLHLRWSEAGFKRMNSGTAALDEFAADPAGFDSQTRKLPGRRGWQVVVRIPARLLPGGRTLRPDDLLRVSYSRYDADQNGKNTILSSTSPHAKASYHRRDEWRVVRLRAAP